MFRKPFKTKSNTRIRSSERRKLRENVLKWYPDFNSEQLLSLIPNKEEISVSRLVTHSEKNVTCYFLNKNPIFFEVDDILLPTVYALWNTNIPLLHFEMPAVVFPVISGGADLMFAGIVQPTNGFPDFTTGTPCFVVLPGNGAAVAVGVTACSKQDITENGLQGKRVTIYHCFKDQLWLVGDKSDPPLLPEISLTFKPSINVVENKQNGEVEQSECDAIEKSSNDGTLNEQVVDEVTNLNDNTTQDMDTLLQNCFCQALLNAKKVELPILVSSFSSQYLHPVCPEGQRIEIKKSSYKKMSKFLAEMQSKKLVEISQLSKGVDSITKISIENDVMETYKASAFAATMKKLNSLKLEEEKQLEMQNKQTVEVKDLYSVSAKVVPFFKLFNISKAAVLSSSDVRQMITEYVKKHELADKNLKNSVTLDSTLVDVLYGKKQHENVLTWDVLVKKMLENMNCCHEVTLPGQNSTIRKGNLEYIEVVVEQRMGNKKVTIIKNLEAYGVDVKSFATSLQQNAASSALVVDAPGKFSTGHHVVVQGLQHKHIKNLLDVYKIPKKYVKGLELAEKKR